MHKLHFDKPWRGTQILIVRVRRIDLFQYRQKSWTLHLASTNVHQWFACDIWCYINVIDWLIDWIRSVTLVAINEAVDWVWAWERWQQYHSVVHWSCVGHVPVLTSECHAAGCHHWPGNIEQCLFRLCFHWLQAVNSLASDQSLVPAVIEFDCIGRDIWPTVLQEILTWQVGMFESWNREQSKWYCCNIVLVTLLHICLLM